MKTLFFTDFSPQARQALEYVASYLDDQKTPCRLILLNVYYPSMKSDTEDGIIREHDKAMEDSREGLQKELKFLEKKYPSSSLSYEILSHFGNLENVLPHLVKRKNINSVILPQDTFDQKVKLKSLPCAVFLIPSGTTYSAAKDMDRFKIN